VTVAEMASECQVRLVITPVMLLRHNVLDVKCDNIVLLMDATILATISRPVAYA
jgi:hypothetical protein